MLISCLAAVLAPISPPAAGDWPQWGYNAARTAITPEELPNKLQLQWSLQLPSPQPAWPESQYKLQFDASYEPIVLGKLLFIGSMISDSITAYDTETGAEKWRYYTQGPVRFAPAAANGRLYAVSDDGYLYCLAAKTGKLLWKFRGGPSDRMVLGNDRLVSMWPARGAPVVYDNRVYFAAGIWPFMGTFIHALDAETGKVVWTNSGSGSTWTKQQHSTGAFAGVAPQGYIAATKDKLLVSGGRTVPAVYDRQTGELIYYHPSVRRVSKDIGGYGVTVNGEYFYNRNIVCNLKDGKDLVAYWPGVTIDNFVHWVKDGKLTASGFPVITEKVKNRYGRTVRISYLKPKWTAKVDPAPDYVTMKAGHRLYGWAEDGAVIAIDIYQEGKPLSSLVGKIAGEPWSLAAADKKLFVVTKEGGVFCFGAKAGGAIPSKTEAMAETSSAAAAAVKAILERSGTSEGYCVLLGIPDTAFVNELIAQSKLHVIAVDRNDKAVAALRRKTDDAGLYGKRIVAVAGCPFTCPLPQYMANLIVADNLPDDEARPAAIRGAYEVLRPYGGAMCFFEKDASKRREIENLLTGMKLPGAKVTAQDTGLVTLRRTGALPDSGTWTHQYANAAKTVVSKDKRVKLPLGLLWFGGPPNDEILPRHGHGPSPQVVGGRLFIEGRNLMRAVDVYTGRLLWQRTIKGLGQYYDNTAHHAGAGDVGSNYVSLADGIYVLTPGGCEVLNPADGKTLRKITLPDDYGLKSGMKPRWGSMTIWKDLLIATTTPIDIFPHRVIRGKKKGSAKPATAPAPLTGGMSLIARGAQWQYLAGSHPKGKWTDPDYKDDAWKSGSAGFGYNDRGNRTVFEDMIDSYSVVYIRRKFNVAKAADLGKLVLLINYDDAFIAYINGTEVLRVGVARGSGADAGEVKDHEAKGFEAFEIKSAAKLLRDGDNVLAVEGHNEDIKSTDFTLDPYLVTLTGDAESALEVTAGVETNAEFASSSKTLMVMDRHSGKVLWTRGARASFRHNGIVAGDGKVFCIDKLSPGRLGVLKRRGVAPNLVSVLYALDARTGKVIWKKADKKEVFGTWLAYSPEHDVLVQCGSRYRDRAWDEVAAGIAVYRAKTGEVVWKDPKLAYSGPLIVYHDELITNGSRGKGIKLLTGEESKWSWARQYGCNTAIASEYLLTFRSGAAGYYDLTRKGGTGNLGGFKSGCTANLIAADGVLSAPDYTRTCLCSYQNQASLAMVHMPDVEVWTFGGKMDERGKTDEGGNVGVNFGAPGDRLDDNGTFWSEYPLEGVRPKRPPLVTKVKGPKTELRYFRMHSSVMKGDGLNWVAASGVEGARSVSLAAEGRYTVRLHFSEPRTDAAKGGRVFSVAIGEREVLGDFDIVSAAGGPNVAVIKEFKGVEADKTLDITLTPSAGKTLLCGVELVPD